MQGPDCPGAPSPWPGNLPYNASTAILTRFLVEPIPWERMVFMFQLEVARKLTGPARHQGLRPALHPGPAHLPDDPGSSSWAPGPSGPRPRWIPRCWSSSRCPGPPPLAQRRPPGLPPPSFNHRRKTLANNWQGWLPPERIQGLLASQGLASAVRAEAVPPRLWLDLFRALS